MIKTNRKEDTNKLMAESAVGSLFQKLGDLIVQEAISLHGVKDQVERLERELQRMRCSLKDVDAKKNEGGMDGEMVNYWVGEMRGLASEVERVIGTHTNLNIRDSIGLIRRYVLQTPICLFIIVLKSPLFSKLICKYLTYPKINMFHLYQRPADNLIKYIWCKIKFYVLISFVNMCDICDRSYYFTY